MRWVKITKLAGKDDRPYGATYWVKGILVSKLEPGSRIKLDCQVTSSLDEKLDFFHTAKIVEVNPEGNGVVVRTTNSLWLVEDIT